MVGHEAFYLAGLVWLGGRVMSATSVDRLTTEPKLQGPMRETTLGGAESFCVFKDDHSYFRHVYF